MGTPTPKTAEHTADNRPVILLLAGFGDNASMFDPLMDTNLAQRCHLLPLNLPGFGAPPLPPPTTLQTLSDFVAEQAAHHGAEIVVAHSVASIIASLAASRPGSPITTLLSLEGNITAEDAYFSGTAADFDTPAAFRAAFLARLDAMAADTPILTRYRQAVSEADPLALWQLGSDARQFSAHTVPGEVLMSAASVVYFYNPSNCPDSTLKWLGQSPMPRIRLDTASHWPSVDQPQTLADRIAEALRLT